jgi:hypothetical protein
VESTATAAESAATAAESTATESFRTSYAGKSVIALHPRRAAVLDPAKGAMTGLWP